MGELCQAVGKLCQAVAMVLHVVRTHAGQFSTEESMDLRGRIIRAMMDFGYAGPVTYIP